MDSMAPRGQNKRRSRAAIPKDDPRRQSLLQKDFMQAGYIEGLVDNPNLNESQDSQSRFDSPDMPTDDMLPGQDEEIALDASSSSDAPYGFAYDDTANVAQQAPISTDDNTPRDTGEMLDPTWASDLIGSDSVPRDDDLVNIGDFGRAGYGHLEPGAFDENGDHPMMPEMQPQPPMPSQPPMDEARNEPSHHHDEHHHHHHRPGRIIRWLKRLLLILMLLAMFIGGFAAGLMYEQQQHPSVSAAFIETQLSECSDLATAKMHYNGLVHYEDGDIPLINKKTFSMTYQAEVRAGVDLSQAKVDVSNGTITVTLPKATVQTTSIDPTSVQFFDQTWGLFSWESKDDAKTALEQAQNDLEANMDDMRLIEEADMNAERTIRGLISPILKMNDGYRLVINTAQE